MERLVQDNQQAGDSVITASAPGKINLYFAGGPKLDNGYHEVCSVYLALNLREQVSVDFADQLSIGVTGSLSAGQLAGVPTDQTNLVVSAARLITDKTLRFEIDKQVPAAALCATGELVGSSAKIDAVRLGADVPFAIMGGVALGMGVGEKLTPLELNTELHVVLITTNAGLSTPMVYSHLDELREKDGLVAEFSPPAPTDLIDALAAGDIASIARLAYNDLQRAALSLKPELQETIDAALNAGALTALVSGSGPTVFAIAESAESAEHIAKRFGTSALVTSGPSAGARLEK